MPTGVWHEEKRAKIAAIIKEKHIHQCQPNRVFKEEQKESCPASKKCPILPPNVHAMPRACYRHLCFPSTLQIYANALQIQGSRILLSLPQK
jgi:hypothetical protein